MMPGPPKITLDQESFKALASEVRVGVLKKLDERRQTVTDLSNLLGLSKPTLLEHLERLQTAGLVKRVDEGRKWIYYELSDKGRKILHPERVSIVIALSSAAVLVAIGILAIVSTAGGLLAGPAAGNTTVTGPQAPAGYTSWFGAGPTAGPLALAAFVLAVAAVGVAAVLYWRGRVRRERMFASLANP